MVQTAPGVYEAPLGEIDPGAYAVRITQTLPGSTPLGRTVGLVAPTAAEYRTLGPNEPFLATLRSATGGTVIETALDPWVHDLTATSRFTDLWPLLLLLALVLWPLDIALRRVSIGRREFAAGRAWLTGLPRRRRATAARGTTGAGLLAARERAGSAAARASLLRNEPPGSTETGEDPGATATTVSGPTPAIQPPTAGRAAAPPEATPATPASPPPSPDPTPGLAPESGDTIARLRDAKRRARER
jgi:hypothetical protein